MGHSYRGATATLLSRIYKGSTSVVRAYKGSTEVWRLETPVPVGMISPYVGDVGSIPSGWSLCDGSGGTPDLRERFVMGTNTEVFVGNTGGSATHTHNLTTAGSHNHDGDTDAQTHSHAATSGDQFAQGDEGYRALPAETDSHVHAISDSTGGLHGHGTSGSGTTGLAAGAQMPPYYVVAFIMKTS